MNRLISIDFCNRSITSKEKAVAFIVANAECERVNLRANLGSCRDSTINPPRCSTLIRASVAT